MMQPQLEKDKRRARLSEAEVDLGGASMRGKLRRINQVLSLSRLEGQVFQGRDDNKSRRISTEERHLLSLRLHECLLPKLYTNMRME